MGGAYSTYGEKEITGVGEQARGKMTTWETKTLTGV